MLLLSDANFATVLALPLIVVMHWVVNRVVRVADHLVGVVAATVHLLGRVAVMVGVRVQKHVAWRRVMIKIVRRLS